MLSRLFGIAVVGAVLGGCAVKSVEEVEPYSTVTLNMPPEQVIAGLSSEQCSAFIYAKSRAYSAERFEIQYFSKNVLSDIPGDIVFGSMTAEGKTVLTMKSISKLQEPYSKVMLRKLQTGKCE